MKYDMKMHVLCPLVDGFFDEKFDSVFPSECSTMVNVLYTHSDVVFHDILFPFRLSAHHL